VAERSRSAAPSSKPFREILAETLQAANQVERDRQAVQDLDRKASTGERIYSTGRKGRKGGNRQRKPRLSADERRREELKRLYRDERKRLAAWRQQRIAQEAKP
jgi:hypothetical protein